MVSRTYEVGRIPQEGTFGRYFPRLFAFVLASCGDEEVARRLSVTAFCEALIDGGSARAGFEVDVFRKARELAHSAVRGRSIDGRRCGSGTSSR